MSILKTIFGSGSILKDGFDLIDSMHTSKEEEIQAKTKAKTDLLGAYAPFKIAQRLLALMFAIVFLSCFALVLVMTMTGEPNIDNIRDVISEFYIGEIMLTIIFFYFGGGAFEGVLRNRVKKDEQ